MYGLFELKIKLFVYIYLIIILLIIDSFAECRAHSILFIDTLK